jgi:hypothetical protein
VVGGYTEPDGTRAHFGSLVLGLYDKEGRLIHVGQVGSGFDQKMLEEIWNVIKKLETQKNPFFGEVEALRKTYWVSRSWWQRLSIPNGRMPLTKAADRNCGPQYFSAYATTKIRRSICWRAVLSPQNPVPSTQ